MDKFNKNHKVVLDKLLMDLPGVRAGKMFGYPAYYAGDKLSICLYKNGVGLKVPEATANRLLESDANIVPFQPLGRRRMREWVQVNLENSEDYRDYIELFEESIQYVLRLQGKSPLG